jgi:asparagine synthase (glutamine-hydrolysing)
MCGIAGKLFLDRTRHVAAEEIAQMLEPITHRGPDGKGVYLDREVGLGHVRLSIIDLAGGHQPMTNEDETVWIAFNGEIYNYRELRERLLSKGHRFRSHSDTEVILHLYEDLGPDCVRELRGMFAFAIWDSKQRQLTLARDRVGIKPLYYHTDSKAFHFASEFKAILADPAVDREVNPEALRQFLTFRYVPGTGTLVKGIHKLLPGHWLTVRDGITQRAYWDLRFSKERCNQSFDSAVEELHELLGETVQGHMISDVPVGLLLSGGVDSSAILGLAAQSSEKRIRTFTVGFDGKQVIDERPYARMAAERFGTEHHEISISEEDFWKFLPAYVWHMEEPVCEPPAVALHYVSQLARGHVKVVLSGEGGDEAFGGYGTYPHMMQVKKLAAGLGPLAGPAALMAGFAGNLLRDQRFTHYGHALNRPLESHYFSRTSGPGTYFNQRAGQFLTPRFLEQTALVSPGDFIGDLLGHAKGQDLLDQMLYIDTKTWLPDDLLVKADKMTMANSLELRVPLLDHKVMEFAASLPPHFKVKGKETKRILKAAFARTLPQEVLNRKKAGFPVPYETWLRNGLREPTEEMLLSDRAISRGYFKKEEVRRLIKGNSRGSGHPKEIFSLLTLELWHQRFVDAVRPSTHTPDSFSVPVSVSQDSAATPRVIAPEYASFS